VLLVVVLIFGTKKLRNVGQDLGGAVKGFKDGMKGDEETHKKVIQDSTIIEGEAKERTQLRFEFDR